MVNQQDKIRLHPLRPVSSLETGAAQPDPALRAGPASGIYTFMTMVAVVFILGVVLYGLNAQRPEHVQTAAAPGASSTASPAAGTTTGQGGDQTTPAAPRRDSSAAGANTNEASGGQPQLSPQDAANRRAGGNQGSGASQAPTNPR